MIRIVLADNHLVIRGGLRALFEARSNIQICGETGDGRGAVDLATQKKPDVVVINVNLPVINGIEATRKIRQAAPDTDVLIYTAENNADLIREALCQAPAAICQNPRPTSKSSSDWRHWPDADRSTQAPHRRGYLTI